MLAVVAHRTVALCASFRTRPYHLSLGMSLASLLGVAGAPGRRDHTSRMRPIAPVTPVSRVPEDSPRLAIFLSRCSGRSWPRLPSPIGHYSRARAPVPRSRVSLTLAFREGRWLAVDLAPITFDLQAGPLCPPSPARAHRYAPPRDPERNSIPAALTVPRSFDLG